MFRLKNGQEKGYNVALQPELIELKKPTTRIGRSANHAEIVMDSVKSPLMISRLHAQVLHDNGTYTILCNGMNGILVNSVKRKKCKLRNGDVVVFGGAGVETADGTIVSSPESELVYVFECPESTEELGQRTKQDNLDLRKKREETKDSKLMHMSVILTDSLSSRGVSSQLTESQDSPGEGTSDGRVRLSKRRRRIKALDSDDESLSPPDRKLCTESSRLSGEWAKRKSTAKKSQDGNETKQWLEDLNEELLCCICRELMILAHALPCSHTFCYCCITSWLREATDCPNCRAEATHKSLVPVKVLDNTIDKVAEKVLPVEELEERKKAIQELLDRKSGRIGDSDIEIHTEYGPARSKKEICDKCHSSINNRILRWRVYSPKACASDFYHFSCFRPLRDVLISQIQFADNISTKDKRRIKNLILKS